MSATRTFSNQTTSKPNAVLGIALMALLGACASSDSPDIAETSLVIPEQWHADAPMSDPVADGWLETLGIPGLMPLVTEALRANPDLRAVAARFGQASLEAAIEEGAAAPAIDLSINAQRDRSHQETANGGRDALYVNEHRLALDVTWEIDIWGRVRANTEAAQAERDAVRQDYYAARLSLAAQAAQALIDFRAARLQRDLTARRVNSFEGTFKRATRRYEHGLTTAFDLNLAASDFSSAKADLAERVEFLATTARTLEILLGRYPANQIESIDGLPALGETIPVGLPATLLERRPDMVASRARLHAAGYRIEAAKAELLPRISLTASGGTSSEDFDKLLDPDYLVASIAGNLVQPIFQGDRLRNRVALNQAAEREALAVYVDRALAAFKEVEDALGAEHWLSRQETALTLGLERAKAAERIAKAQYERGLIKILELLAAQRRRLDAEDRLLDLRRQRINNRIALHLALGGDFARAPREHQRDRGDLSS